MESSPYSTLGESTLNFSISILKLDEHHASDPKGAYSAEGVLKDALSSKLFWFYATTVKLLELWGRSAYKPLVNLYGER
jgi:hypothetical protein